MFKFSKQANNNDKSSLRNIIAQAIASIVLLCVGGSIGLAILEKPTPELVKNLGTSASGALIAILITSDDEK